MFKLESYITPLLMGYLDKYVKLRHEDFQLSLWGGDAVLSNLDLRLDELEKVLQLPVVFQSGHIHELRLHVPWTKLGSEPVVVTINTVECIVKVRDTAYEGSSTSHSSEAAAKAAQQKLKAKRRQDEEELPPGYLQSIVKRIINNVAFVFNNLILKFVEDDIVLSVNIKSAECYSVDRDWNRAFVDLAPDDLALRKVLNFADLTMCLDKTNASGHIESYQEPLAYRCAVTCRLYMSYESVTAKFPKATRFNVYCDTLNLSLTDTQLPMFVRLMELFIAMYYGYLDIPTPTDHMNSSTSTAMEKVKAQEGTSVDVDSQGMDDGQNEGWATWAWSFVPQILPPGEEEDEGGGTARRGRVSPLILSIGFYIHQGNIIFKMTESAKEGSELPHKKIHFHPFLTMTFEGASVEVLLQGLQFCDVQSGISACRIFTNGNCICGVLDDDVERCNTLLRAGEPLSQKMKITYLSNSLFDATSFENQGHPVPYILDREVHSQTYTEQYGLTKFGAFWQDYLYTYEKPERTRSGGSNSSDTDHVEAIFEREFSTLRFLLGDCHMVLSSTLYHRLSKFISCMWDHQYEPYGAGKGWNVGSEDRPKPTEEQIMSLEEFIPTQLIHLALINPSVTVITSEHPECNLAKKTYRSRHRKKDSKKDESQQSKDLAALVIGASRFDLQVTKPMYPGRLIKLVSAIAGPSSNLVHHCHRHTQIKLFSLQVGVQRAGINGSVTRPLTLVPPCSFAQYIRALLLPKLWNNSSLPLSEWMYEIPNASINVNKPSVIMVSQIVSSWLAPKATPKVSWMEDSLLDDLFPTSGESTQQNYPLLELNVCGMEFKSCSSTMVHACTASISSIQVVLYTPGVGGKMSVVPILYGPSNTSQLTKTDFFAKKDVATADHVTSDCITVTLQKPKNTTVREVPALALVDCQGLAMWFDPGLMGWFHYCPQPRPMAKVDQQQTQVTLDLSLAEMTSPLNAASRTSVRSTSSPSRTGGSQPMTQSPRGVRDVRSHHVSSHQYKDGKNEDSPDKEGTTLGEFFAGYFPLVQALHLQVDIKPSVLFLPKTGLPTTTESCEDLVTAVQQAFVNGWLSPTLVVCLPSILVTSTMAKPMNVLQELPVKDAQGSLIGERLPWTIRLLHTCVYSLIPGRSEPSFLLHPVDIVSTLAVNSTYNPPTSEQISSLALCIHVDVGAVITDWTGAQLHLLSITAGQMSSIVGNVSGLVHSCLKMFSTSKTSSQSTPSPRDQTSVRKSVSSSTHKIHTSTQSMQSGEATDQVVTDISEDTSHDAASPLHENILNNEDETGTKLSLWLQLMLPKVGCNVFHTCPHSHKESGVSLMFEELDMCLDSQSVYSKVKLNLSSFSIQHSSRRPDGSWDWSDLDGIIVSCSQQLPRNLRTISNKLWVSDNPAAVSFSQNHDAIGRDKKHGVLSVTLTHALCKNVKKRLKKANVELPSVTGIGSDPGNLPSVQCDKGFFYFHEYLSEICVKLGPVDVVMKPEAVDILMGFLTGLNSKEKSKTTGRFTSDKFVLVPGSPSGSSSSSAITESFSVQNLPLIYANIGMLRLFVPLSSNKRTSTSRNVQATCDKPSSLSSSPPLTTTATSSKPTTTTQQEWASTSVTSAPPLSVIDRNTKNIAKPTDNQTNIPTQYGPSATHTVKDSVNTNHSQEAFMQRVIHGTRVNMPNVPVNERKTDNVDGSGCWMSSTLDHTMVMVSVGSLNIQPHADNPLPRTAQEKSVFQQALQSGHAHQPGSSVEDRQYQVEIKGLAFSTGCWDQVMQETRQTVTQRSPTSSMVQIPALEWNTFLMDGPGHERKEILLAPLASAFDVCLVLAPPIHCTPNTPDLQDPQTYLICGMTAELNMTSDLDLYLSNGQVELLSLLASQLSASLDPSHMSPSSSSSSPSLLHQSTPPMPSHTDHTRDSKKRAGNKGLISDFHHQNLLAVDSGVESDISTLTFDHGNRGNDHTTSKKYNTPEEKEKRGGTIAEDNVATNMIDGRSPFGLLGERKGEKERGKEESDSSPFVVDLLLTAGRISCTVYTHKILECNVTQELPLFRERKSSHRVRHQSSVTPAPTADSPVTPCRDNLEQRLRSLPFSRYNSIGSNMSGEVREEEDSSDSNEEPFTEFNFMKTTSYPQGVSWPAPCPAVLNTELENFGSVRKGKQQSSVETLQKTIPSGSVCMLPFVYVYMTQPHCIMARQGVSGKDTKLELSCYDVLVKGASDSHLAPIEEYHMIPDCADFNVHWLETRAGLPHPYTGIPPSLLTVRVVKGQGQPAMASLHLERPLRLKVSQLAIEQTVTFCMELAAMLKQPTVPATTTTNTTTTTRSTSKGKNYNNAEECRETDIAQGQGVACGIDRLELSTSQVVVVMETGESEGSPMVGAVASLEGLELEIDVDRSGTAEIPPSIVGHAHLKDALVKLNYEKKSNPLIGPLTVSMETSLTWIPVSANRAKPQLLVMVDTGLVLIKVGQEHVFCLTQLSTRLIQLYQTLLSDLSSLSTTPSTEPSVSRRTGEATTMKEDFVQDQTHDDLRRGGFEYIEEPEGISLEPEANQIIFSSHSVTDQRHGGNGYMCWRYEQPRVITGIQLTPVPFGLATSSMENILEGQTKVQCLLQYYDELQEDFTTCEQFQLSESEPVTIEMPDVKTHNASQLVIASLWRVLLLRSSAKGDAAVLPVSLAACMCVDSVFIPSLIPSVKVSVTLPMVDIRLCHHLDYNGTEMPSKLKRFYPLSDLVEEQEFAVVRFNDIHAAVCQVLGSDPRATLKLSLTNSLEVLDYTCLAMKPVLEPFSMCGEASLIGRDNQKQEVEGQMKMEDVRLCIGKNVMHSLNMAVAAWSSFNPSRSGPLLVFSHYVVCNDTTSVLRFGQSGTDENICLRSREMYAYSWRSFTTAQLLHLCFDQPTWRWTDPFPIDNQGVWVRTVKANDQEYAVIVKVTKLSPVQVQVTITGQLLVSNQLSLPLLVRVGVEDGDGSSDRGLPLSHQHQYVLQPGHCLPSLVSSKVMTSPIQLRLAGFSTPWCHEIYLSGDRMKETLLIKIPMPGDSASYFHIWCRIFCQHFQGKSQKLVMLTPLYVVRTHFPQPLFICLDSTKVKERQELLVKSQGQDFHLHLQGGDITHSMAFRLGPGKQKSSPPVILSTGLIGQLEREQSATPDIECLCNLQLDTGHLTWPYLEVDDSRDGEVIGLGDQQEHKTPSHLQATFPNDPALDPHQVGLEPQQPSIDLSVHLSEYIPGCETLLVNVTPACLVTNVTGLCVVVGEVLGSEGEDGKTEIGDGEKINGRRWMLNPGQTMSPPLPKDLLSVAIVDKGQITQAKSIPLSGKPMDYKRYNEDIGKVLFIDGYVQVTFVASSSSKQANMTELVFLTLTSDLQNGIRTICIRETFCVGNMHPIPLTSKFLAVPKTNPRGSTLMAQADALTLTLEGKGQGEKELTPIARWSVIDGAGDNGETTFQQESLVLYIAFCAVKDVEDSSPSVWSVPVRIITLKDSTRCTTSLPRIHSIINKGNVSSAPSPAAPTDVWTTQALCITTHYRRGVINLIVMEDAAPVLVVENMCPFAVHYGQACGQLRTDEVTIQEQLELVSDLPLVSPGGWCHYTPPAINAQFGATETINMPRIHFREATGPSQWSSPVQVSGTDAFVRLQDICDLKIMIEVIGMVTHLVIRPVSKAEITAKEIRTRLKDGEFEKREAALSTLGTNKLLDNTSVFSTDKVSSLNDSAKNNPLLSLDTIEKFSEREDIKEKYLKNSAFNLTIGVFSESVTVILQDETYPADAKDILAIHMKDLFLASFPISRNPSEVVSKNCFALSVGYTQIDNQLCGSGSYDFPVVFIPQITSADSNTPVDERRPFHNLSSSAVAKMSVIESIAFLRSESMIHAQIVTLADPIWGQSVIDLVDISVQPCSLYIDDSFVYKLIEELESFVPSKMSMSNSQTTTEALTLYSKVPKKIACHACELSRPVRIRILSIQQIRMLLSVHASLKLFLASDHTPLNLAKFERMSVYSNTQRLIHSITMHYASAAIFRAGIVVGSLEILGNPTGLVRSISAGVSDLVSLPYSGLTRGPGAFIGGVTRGLGSFFTNVSAGMITSMTNFASSVSRNMDRLSLDERHLERQEENRRSRPNGISQGVVQGLSGFGLSLLGAVAGLADQPLRTLVQSDSTGEQRSPSATSTASGLVAGMGKGLVGVLTKPIGGAAELVSQTGQGILQGTGLGKMPTRLHPPLPPSSSSVFQSHRTTVWSSGFKYAVKVLNSLPSPILLSFPALTFDLLGGEVEVVLVLTSDLLVIINVEEDAQQQTLSLSELECHHCQEDEEDEDMDIDSRQNKDSEERRDETDVIDDDDDDADEEEDDSSNGLRPSRAECERLGSFTLVWTDHYYNSSSLEHQHDASKERVAAFIDSTQNLTTCHMVPDMKDSTIPIKGTLSEPHPKHRADSRSETDVPLQSHGAQRAGRSMSVSSQNDPRHVKISTHTDTPKFKFKMSVHCMRIFLTVFHTAKYRLEGKGFTV